MSSLVSVLPISCADAVDDKESKVSCSLRIGNGELGFVIVYDEDCEYLGCMGLARIGADAMMGALTFTRGRRHTVNTRSHFCPDPDCSYDGWLGRGNLRANGHPRGQPWRQLQCVSCHGYFSETHGTIFYDKRLSADLIVRVIACLAEGLGIRSTARVFEIDLNTVLQWLVEAAEHLTRIFHKKAQTSCKSLIE